MELIMKDYLILTLLALLKLGVQFYVPSNQRFRGRTSIRPRILFSLDSFFNPLSYVLPLLQSTHSS